MDAVQQAKLEGAIAALKHTQGEVSQADDWFEIEARRLLGISATMEDPSEKGPFLIFADGEFMKRVDTFAEVEEENYRANFATSGNIVISHVSERKAYAAPELLKALKDVTQAYISSMGSELDSSFESWLAENGDADPTLGIARIALILAEPDVPITF